MNKSKKIGFLKNIWPYLFLLFSTFIFFWKFFLKGQIAMPADITVGMYYPWLNYKWGGYQTNVPVKNPLMSDIVSIIYQWRIMAINSIKSGSFPFWQRQYFVGMPLFANFQNSLINLTNIPLFLIKDQGIGWTLMVFLQLLFSLYASYQCFRVFNFNKISSLIASCVYSFSLFSIVWLEYGIHTYVAAFLPLIILCIEKYGQTKKTKFLVFISFLIALQFYGGYPQYSIYTLIFTSLYFLFFQDKNLKNKIKTISIYVILGLFLTLPLLMTGYELVKLSIHSIDQSSLGETKGFLPAKNLFTLPVPNFFGNPATYDYQGEGFYDNNAVFPGSIAILSLIIASLLLIKKKLDHKTLFFLLTIILSFIISIKNPISIILKEKFGFIFAGNSIATRIFLLGNFSFSFITAFIVNNIKNINKKIIYQSLILFIVWQFTLIIFSKHNFFIFSPVSLKNSLYSVIISLPIFLSFFLYKRTKNFKKLFSLVLLFTCSFELIYYGLKYTPFSNKEFLFPKTNSIEFLKNNSNDYRVSTVNTIPPNMWVPYGLSSPNGYDATLPYLNYEYFSFVENNRFSESASRAIYLTNLDSNLYQNFSVKYNLALGNQPIKTTSKEKKIHTISNEENTYIEEILDVLPKYRLTNKIVFVNDKNEFVKTASNTDFSSTTIFYSKDNEKINISPCEDKDSNVTLISEKNNSVHLRSNSRYQQILFISNSYYPGWKAYINNSSSEIFQANHMFQAILLEPGEHEIRLVYYPTNFNLYIILSISSAIVLLFLLKKDLKV
ncbi:MAG TPA: YfhO family protein [Candidatus Woesebacteria bacterium]|jgi:uncharacterized membrane protein YfhO|nr:YfhO family protein [Candidatus Shapirobacteria bacterium]HOR02196.1 YfhO family protein [Candidatus Woesebacteria bacterium]